MCHLIFYCILALFFPPSLSLSSPHTLPLSLRLSLLPSLPSSICLTACCLSPCCLQAVVLRVSAFHPAAWRRAAPSRRSPAAASPSAAASPRHPPPPLLPASSPPQGPAPSRLRAGRRLDGHSHDGFGKLWLCRALGNVRPWEARAGGALSPVRRFHAHPPGQGMTAAQPGPSSSSSFGIPVSWVWD